MSDTPAVPVPDAPSALALVDVAKSFGDVDAATSISFEVAAGEVLALIGENGAGKSTACHIASGLLTPDSGQILRRGLPVSYSSPADAMASGVAMVHQRPRLVPAFTVAECLVLGDGRPLSRKRARDRVVELGVLHGLPLDPDAVVGDLGVGDQQRLETLRALHREAEVLLMDEPTVALAPVEVDGLFDRLRALVADGRSVVVVTHKLDEIASLCDRVTVVRDGATVGTVEPGSSTVDELASMMAGRSVTPDSGPPERDIPRDRVAVVASGISCLGDSGRTVVHGVDLTVAPGEIVGICGVAGNGQIELAEALVGLRPRTGDVEVGGTRVASGRPGAAVAARLGYAPADGLGNGLAPGLSVADNLVAKSFRRAPYSRGPFLRRRRLRSHAAELVDRFEIRAPGRSATTVNLAGGDVQKVLLARELDGDPIAIIAASPTRGLGVAAAEAVRRRLYSAAESGVAVLVVSDDLDEVLAMSDRVGVMYKGALVRWFDRADARRREVGAYMGGGTVAERSSVDEPWAVDDVWATSDPAESESVTRTGTTVRIAEAAGPDPTVEHLLEQDDGLEDDW